MILNDLMTADERHLRGSGFFIYVAFTFWPKIGLGHARDVDGRDRNETLVRLEAVYVCFLGTL